MRRTVRSNRSSAPGSVSISSGFSFLGRFAMATTIMPTFGRYPQEAAIVGRLLAGYADLELELCYCVACARDDFDMVFKSLFRSRGETQRIDIADAMGRQEYRELRLSTHFEEAIAGLRYCLKIRNQFAHCQWHDDLTGKLGFVQLEDLAKSNPPVTDLGAVTIQHLSLKLLQKQEAYFGFIARCLRYINYEGRKRAGKLAKHPFVMPKKGKRPALCIP